MLKEHEVRQAILQQYPNIPKHHIHRIYVSTKDFTHLKSALYIYIRHNVVDYDKNQHGYNHYHVTRVAFAHRDIEQEVRDVLQQWRGVQNEKVS